MIKPYWQQYSKLAENIQNILRTCMCFHYDTSPKFSFVAATELQLKKPMGKILQANPSSGFPIRSRYSV